MDLISFVVDIKLILILVGLDDKQYHIETSIKLILITMISAGHLTVYHTTEIKATAAGLCISLLKPLLYFPRPRVC